MKKILPIILSLCLTFGICVSVVNADNLPINIDVGNSTPEIVRQSINNTAWSSVATTVPFVEFYYNFTVYDADGIADIKDSKITLTFNYFLTDNPSQHYEANYTEGTSAWLLLKPTVAAPNEYLKEVDCDRIVEDLYNISYSYAFILNKTAQDTNSALTWYFIAESTDMSDSTGTSQLAFAMGPFSEIAVTGNDGVTAFRWTGTAQSTQSVTFYTEVTSNDGYELNASYTGFLSALGGATWGDPELAVRQESGTFVSVPNATASPGTNTSWHTTLNLVYEGNLTHYMTLVFPVGITKDLTYDGVDIWIQVKNE